MHRPTVTLFLAAMLSPALGCSGAGSSGGKGDGGIQPATTGGGSSTTGVGGSCAPQAGDDACNACIRSTCCPETTACNANAACQAIARCAENCTDDTCYDGCFTASPTGAAAYDALVTCATDKCPSCGSTPGGDAGLPSDKCLPGTMIDPSYCDGSGRTMGHDCPGGSPYPDCVASPTGASGVYCCNE